MLLLGKAGAIRYRKLPDLRPGLLFAMIIFGYMAINFCFLEMRYLLQADVLIPAALLLASWVPRCWANPSLQS